MREDNINNNIRSENMKKLSNQEFQILNFYFWKGLTLEEIGQKMGKGRSYICHKKREGLEKLQKYFK